MVKVYELSRYDAMTVRVIYLSQTIMVPFKGGVSARVRARFITTNKFYQDAIENDPRYGKLFVKVREFEDTPSKNVRSNAVDNKPKKVAKVKTVNEALLYFTTLGANVTGESDLNTLMTKYNVEFPNLTK